MSKKILIVDDEVDVCEFMQNFFRKRKYEVLICHNGNDALNMFTSNNPDLMLLDIKMEGLDGLQVLEQLKKQNPNAKVIMVSGTENSGAVEHAKQLGALDFIHKPLKLEEIEKVVLGILNKP
jgi:DNA-binding NtrC family response regulator